MNGFVKCAGALVALELCSACTGSSAIAPSTVAPDVRYIGRTLAVNGRPVTAAEVRTLPRFATIAPDASTKAKHFEYIFNDYGTYASIFDYPTSVKEIGSIRGDGGQGCTNVLYGYGKKSFWDVAGDTDIVEYDVLKKPIKTLSVSVGMPSSCAMDSSGDLAVGILSGAGGGDIVVFKNASGSGTVFKSPLAREYFDGYDENGNLFFDGFTVDSQFQLDELPQGSTKVQKIITSNHVEFPGSVQWDGTYLAVTDQIANAIYRYTVSGTKATLEDTVSLSTSSDCAQTWIVKGLIYCADAGNDDGEVFKYPAGGSAIAVFTGNFDVPLGTVAVRR
ncbi:MAG: hypothetical protein JOZ77_10625 [Candidatus Eremiobacteraeota bacterium]|nr:hypothetical protein [Candidatus Eremiobacteraeota bacterium]